jgi:hypothetical protein
MARLVAAARSGGKAAIEAPWGLWGKIDGSGGVRGLAVPGPFFEQLTKQLVELVIRADSPDPDSVPCIGLRIVDCSNVTCIDAPQRSKPVERFGIGGTGITFKGLELLKDRFLLYPAKPIKIALNVLS